MSGLPKFLLIVSAEINPEVESAWNEWYDSIHLPEALSCPGVLSGSRYISSGEASLTKEGKKSQSLKKTYIAIYELNGPEALATPEFVEMRGWYQFTNKIVARTQLFEKV